MTRLDIRVHNNWDIAEYYWSWMTFDKIFDVLSNPIAHSLEL